MFRHLKPVSMMLLLLGTSTGAALATTYPNINGINITQQNTNCKGVVKDANGEVIIGASVVVKGTTNGTITGMDGDFSIPNVKKGDIIQISFIGYATKEVAWKGTPLKIVLVEDAKALEDVVVIPECRCCSCHKLT